MNVKMSYYYYLFYYQSIYYQDCSTISSVTMTGIKVYWKQRAIAKGKWERGDMYSEAPNTMEIENGETKIKTRLMLPSKYARTMVSNVVRRWQFKLFYIFQFYIIFWESLFAYMSWGGGGGASRFWRCLGGASLKNKCLGNTLPLRDPGSNPSGNKKLGMKCFI